MTRKRRLTWLFRAMAVPLAIGVVLVCCGFQFKVTPLLIVGIVVFVLGTAGGVVIKIISRHPPVKLVRRWKAYVALKEDGITDYAAELDSIAENYRADVRKDKNILDKPAISDVRSFCDFSVLKTGKIYYGCIVQANAKLFLQSEKIDEVLPAAVVYSRDEYYNASPKELKKIADALYKNKENNILRYSTLYLFNEKLDESFTGGREVFFTNMLICRAHIPMGMLGSWRILPIIADPEKCKSAFVVDCQYWTNKLVHTYITADDKVDDKSAPSDTYADPFSHLTDKKAGAVRTLTVKRKWSIVECFAKIYLYVQCPKKASTHNVDGNYFKQIRIKNGKTAEAVISDDYTIIMIGTNTAYTKYTVPAGADDVSLLAVPHYIPAENNPFTFEVVE